MESCSEELHHRTTTMRGTYLIEGELPPPSWENKLGLERLCALQVGATRRRESPWAQQGLGANPHPSCQASGRRGSKETRWEGSLRNGLMITNIYISFTMHEAFLYTLCHSILKIQPQDFLHSTGTLEADADKKWHITRSLGLTTLEWELSCTSSVPSFVSDSQQS